MRVQAGVESDVEPCIRLWLSAIEARDGRMPPVGSDQRARGKFDAERVAFVVARDESRALEGFALLTAPGTGRDDDPADAAYLSMIAVAPGAQGRGCATALLNATLAVAAEAGHPRAVLHVLQGNTAAVALYSKRGWEQAGAPFPYALTGEPTLTLVTSTAA